MIKGSKEFSLDVREMIKTALSTLVGKECNPMDLKDIITDVIEFDLLKDKDHNLEMFQKYVPVIEYFLKYENELGTLYIFDDSLGDFYEDAVVSLASNIISWAISNGIYDDAKGIDMPDKIIIDNDFIYKLEKELYNCFYDNVEVFWNETSYWDDEDL